MLLFINPLAPAQLQAALMQEKARRSQDKQSQQHPCAAGGDAGRAKDAPAQTPGPGGPKNQLGGARAQLGVLQDQSPSTPQTGAVAPALPTHVTDGDARGQDANPEGPTEGLSSGGWR